MNDEQQQTIQQSNKLRSHLLETGSAEVAMENESTADEQPNTTVVTFQDLSPLTAATQQRQGQDEEQQQQEGTTTAMVSTTTTEGDEEQDEPFEVATGRSDANDEDDTTTNDSTTLSQNKRKPPKKKANQYIREQFEISPDPDREGYLKIVCIHCKMYKNWKTFNASVASDHIVQKCKSAPTEIRQLCDGQTQASKRAKKQLGLIVGGPLSQERVMASESSGASSSVSSLSTSLRDKARSKPGDKAGRKKHQQSSIQSFGTVLTEQMANRLIMKSVETTLARLEPMQRLLDPFVQDELVTRFGKGIMKFVPHHPDTIYKRYVMVIDKQCQLELNTMMQKIPGGMTIAADGVTCNGTSTILSTIAKGSVTLFAKASRLRNLAHATEAETQDMVDFMVKTRREYNSPLCCVATDNAATKVVKEACAIYKSNNPKEPNILSNRDCAHCIDLLAKDVAKVPCIDSLLSDIAMLMEFSTTDNVDGIRHELVRTGDLPATCGNVSNYSETRFNKVGMTLESVLNQKPFYEWCNGHHPMFEQYYNSRTQRRKEKIDATLRLVTRDLWAKVEVVAKIYAVIEHATKLVSDDDFPISAYYPVIVAMRNELNGVLGSGTASGSRSIDAIFNLRGARNSIVEFCDNRFNYDGSEPPGRKVGLLDKYQIWAFLVDPFRSRIPKRPIIHPSIARCMQDAIEFFVIPAQEPPPPPPPNAGPVEPPNMRPTVWGRVEAPDTRDIRLIVDQEFRSYLGHTGKWIDLFPTESPRPPSDRFQEERELTIQMVSQWVSTTGGHQGRLEFFSIAPPSKLYDLVIEPLLSVRSTGSISVERVAKPLKNNVWSKLRSNLGQDKAEVCLRAGLNLRYLMKVRSTVHKATNEQVVDHCDDDLFGSISMY